MPHYIWKVDTLFYYVTAVICIVRNLCRDWRADRTADLQLVGNDRENCDRGDAGSHVRIPGCHCSGAYCVVYYDHSAIDKDLTS